MTQACRPHRVPGLRGGRGRLHRRVLREWCVPWVWDHHHRRPATATVLVDVNPWAFHQQRTYPLSVDASAGDKLETHCTWQNTTDEYILPGPRTEDEMCTTALIAWPADAANCQ